MHADPPPPSPALAPLAHEVLIDVSGCAPGSLASVDVLRGLCDAWVGALGLTVVHPPLLHRFGDTPAGPGGVTALYLLSESHLAAHTWPEHGAMLLSLCSCRPVAEDATLDALLQRHLGPVRTRVRRLVRTLP